MENQIIDVAIGLALAFMIVSVLVSAVQEFLAGFLDTRSKQLAKGIKCLLFGDTDPKTDAEKNFITDLFKHPLLYNLSKGELLPSYLPAENFAKAIVETSAKQLQDAGRSIKVARDLVEAVNASPARKFLTPLMLEAGEDIEHFRVQLETQYDHQMDRVSGWYKRYVQWYMLLYGFLIAAFLNVDALQLTHRLWADPVVRAAVVSSATSLPKESKPDALTIERDLSKLNISTLPIGWPAAWWNVQSSSDPFCALWGIAKSLIGWLITALAASLGAPFWFDAVGKLVRLRGAGAAQGKTPKTPPKKERTPSAMRPTQPDPADQRNAIIELHATRHQDDPSYRPVQAEEHWQ